MFAGVIGRPGAEQAKSLHYCNEALARFLALKGGLPSMF